MVRCRRDVGEMFPCLFYHLTTCAIDSYQMGEMGGIGFTAFFV